MSESKLFGALILGLFATTAAVVFCIAFVATWIDAGYQHRQCNRYSEVSGRQTQFRKFSHWSYDCYVKTSEGKWVLKSQVWDEAP